MVKETGGHKIFINPYGQTCEIIVKKYKAKKRSDKSLHQDGIFYPVFFNFLFQTTHINHKKDTF